MEAEPEAAVATTNAYMVYSDAYTFPALGYMNGDNLHWNQTGLNLAGTDGAEAVSAVI